MKQTVKRIVSTDSSLWLSYLRKSLSALDRAIPKGIDPSIKTEPINEYRVRLIAEWNEDV